MSIQGQALFLEPKHSTVLYETHADLVTTNDSFTDATISLDMKTVSQTSAYPNAWEAGWVLWDYQSNTEFYYFVLKPNGWELGKEDPNYPGAQRFLATGSSPTFAIGSEHHVEISQTHDATSTTLSVTVDGTLLTTFTDSEAPYTTGKVGLYTEDARVAFDNLNVHDRTNSVSENFEGFANQTITNDGASIGAELYVNFLGYGQAQIGPGSSSTAAPTSYTGSAGADTLTGTAANDYISGKGGADRITGGGGNDTLSGGNGADLFLFGPGFGQDVITDFAGGTGRGHDTVKLTGIGTDTTYSKFMAHTVNTPDGALFTVGGTGTDTILFAGVAKASLVSADFLFA